MAKVDINLTVNSMNESVVVSSAAPILDTQNATTGTPSLPILHDRLFFFNYQGTSAHSTTEFRSVATAGMRAGLVPTLGTTPIRPRSTSSRT